MRCPDCNKFTSMDLSEPEVELDVDDDGNVTAEINLSRTCADCGTELKTGSLTAEEQVDVAAHQGEGHDLTVEETGIESIEEGGGRYAKSYFGAAVNFEVHCSCQTAAVATGTVSGKMAASEMDEAC